MGGALLYDLLIIPTENNSILFLEFHCIILIDIVATTTAIAVAAASSVDTSTAIRGMPAVYVSAVSAASIVWR